MAGGAAITAGWRQVKASLHYITNIIIAKAVVKDDAGEAIMGYCTTRARRSPLGTRIFGGIESYVHPKRWNEVVGYEGMSGDAMLVRFKNSYALVSYMPNNSSNGPVGQTYKDYCNIINIRYIRGTFDLEAFLLEAIDYYNAQKRQVHNNYINGVARNQRRRFFIKRNGSRQSNTVSVSAKATPFSDGPEGGPASNSSNSGQILNMVVNGMVRLLRWNNEDLQLQPEDGQSPFTGYPFPSRVQEAIVEVDHWLKNEKWFRSKSIPWRRGWLLHGKPGTGKSTLVRALGMVFDLPVFIFDINGMNNAEFCENWEMALSNTPCIVLIEDIDAVFNKRQYIGAASTIKEHLTFDCVLNNISGVKSADGIFMIITTNHLEVLDEALGVPDNTGKSTRPGRIDRAIRLDEMEEPERVALAKHILAEYPDLIDQAVKDGNGETAAQFQARCATLALNRFWKGKT